LIVLICESPLSDWLVGSDRIGHDGDRDIDVAACSAGIRTNLVPLFHEGFGSFVIRAGQCDIETGGE